MLNKKGDFIGTAVALIIFVAVILAVVYALSGPGSEFSNAVGNMPEAIQSIFGLYYKVFSPIVSFVFNMVKPAEFDVNSNGAYIAFGVFLLLVIVGTKSLKPFFRSDVLSFLIAAIVGLIASRSLTDELLNDALIKGGPLAAVAFLLAVVPLLGVNYFVNKIFPYDPFGSEGSKTDNSKKLLMKLGIYVILIVAYYFMFERLSAARLGMFYAVAIGIFAIGDLLLPGIRRKQEQQRSRSTGRFVGFWGRLFRRTQQAQEGAQETIEGGGRI